MNCSLSNCPNTHCGISLIPESNYCHKCGKKLTPNEFQSRYAAIFLITATILCVGYFYLEDTFLGSKPTASESVQENLPDQRIELLKEDSAKNPGDINRWRALAEAIQIKLSSSSKPDQNLIFDLIDALRGILSLDPKDKTALLGMADIAYTQQAFDKASEFYENYLKVDPKDDSARANYASSLSFVGKFKEAEKELLSLISKDPKNFQAYAYLSIMYSRSGNIDQAKKFGEKALILSPDEEARSRFQAYLTSLDKSTKTSQKIESQTQSSGSTSSVVNSPKGKFLQFIFQHPIIGPKISKHEFKDKSLILTMKDFPMSQMPEFAKEKLFNRLKEEAKGAELSDLNEIIFLDIKDNSELSKVLLK